MNTITVDEMGDNLGDVVEEAENGEVFLVSDKSGNKIAVLIPYLMYDEIKEMINDYL